MIDSTNGKNKVHIEIRIQGKTRQFGTFSGYLDIRELRRCWRR